MRSPALYWFGAIGLLICVLTLLPIVFEISMPEWAIVLVMAVGLLVIGVAAALRFLRRS